MTLTITHAKNVAIADDPKASAAGEVLPSDWNANHTIAGTVDASIGARTKVTGDVVFFVNNISGSDSNDGTSSGSAFATLQHAWDSLSGSLDLGEHNLTINLAASATAYLLDAEQGFLGGSTVNIIGAGSSTTTIQDLAFGQTNVFPLGCGAVNVDKVTLIEVALGYCAVTSALGTVNISSRGGDVVIGSSSTQFVGIGATQPGALISLFDVKFNGYSGVMALQATTGGMVLGRGNSTLTVVGSPAFSEGFAVGGDDGIIVFFGTIIPGTATGPRFDVFGNATIDTNGGGANYFPGNSPGTWETGGVYVGVTATTVAALPTGISAGERNFVVDSTATLAAGLGNIVAGGAGNSVPVYFDGTNWRIG